MTTNDSPSLARSSLPSLCLLALAAALAPLPPALGQGRELSELLSDRSVPLSVKLKDLNEDWRRLTVHSVASISDNVAVNVSGNSTSGSTSQNNNLIGGLASSRSYLTKGQTVSASGRSYLVAYHLPGTGLDLSMLVQAVATKALPTTATLTPESTLPLSLLDLGAIGSLEDIRVFDVSSEIADSQKAAKILVDLLKSQTSGGGTNKAPSKPKPDSGGANKAPAGPKSDSDQ